MKGKLNHSDVLKFIFAGNSKFTTVNTETGNRFTFHVKQAKDSNLFFVKILTNGQYNFIGTITAGIYTHGKKSNVSVDAQSVKVINYIIDKLKTNTLKECVEIWHEGTCGKCGRPLTVPSSIILGIGPQCVKTISKVDKRDKFLELLLS